MWCKTRLFNSGGQFDQLFNLIDGAILARVLWWRIVELLSPTAMGVPRCVCVFVLRDGSPKWITLVSCYAAAFSSARTVKNQFFDRLQSVLSEVSQSDHCIVVGDSTLALGRVLRVTTGVTWVEYTDLAVGTHVESNCCPLLL